MAKKTNLTKKYYDLSNRITSLKKALPRVKNPPLVYADNELDLILSFCLLAHAEIESYLEERARDTVNEAFQLFKSTGAIKPPVLALAIYFHPLRVGLNENNANEIVNKGMSHAIAQTIRFYLSNLEDNNGVRQSNTEKLFKAIGMDYDKYNTLWATLDSYGQLRGSYAHLGKAKITRILSPKEASDTVRDILRDLKDVDRELSVLNQ